MQSFFCYNVVLLHCVLCILITLTSCQDEDPSPTDNTQSSGLGSTQIYQPPPTTPSACMYFDSRDNTSRECTLTTSCFSYIRRQDDGTYRVKRGCSFDCQDEARQRKIQVCCSTHLCNNHTLTPENFTNLPTPTPRPPPQCYQSDTNGTCTMSTACYSRLIYRSDGTNVTRQGCIRGPECPTISNQRKVQRCCTTHLCNTPIPPLLAPSQCPHHGPHLPPHGHQPHPLHATPLRLPPHHLDLHPPSLRPDEPEIPSLTCHCSECGSQSCQGVLCANRIAYSDRPIPTITQVCIADSAQCTNSASDPDPQPGTIHLLCCDSDNCNAPLALPTLATPPTTPTNRTTTVRTAGPETTGTTVSATTLTEGSSPPVSSSDELYFTFTSVLSVAGGLIVVGVIAVVIVMLALHIRRSRRTKTLQLSNRSLQQQQQRSPDCHLTSCLQPSAKGSPLASTTSSSTSTSTSSSSGELHLHLDLKHLGTSV